mmetsp:Transcript_18846/g.38364  ORF Transcript_18846/g.38364 Transcript_18846/m.38364 type:complete len:281 (-) Transcript_18846:63-905(-)
MLTRVQGAGQKEGRASAHIGGDAVRPLAQPPERVTRDGSACGRSLLLPLLELDDLSLVPNPLPLVWLGLPDQPYSASEDANLLLARPEDGDGGGCGCRHLDAGRHRHNDVMAEAAAHDQALAPGALVLPLLHRGLVADAVQLELLAEASRDALYGVVQVAACATPQRLTELSGASAHRAHSQLSLLVRHLQQRVHFHRLLAERSGRSDTHRTSEHGEALSRRPPLQDAQDPVQRAGLPRREHLRVNGIDSDLNRLWHSDRHHANARHCAGGQAMSQHAAT